MVEVEVTETVRSMRGRREPVITTPTDGDEVTFTGDVGFETRRPFAETPASVGVLQEPRMVVGPRPEPDMLLDEAGLITITTQAEKTAVVETREAGSGPDLTMAPMTEAMQTITGETVGRPTSPSRLVALRTGVRAPVMASAATPVLLEGRQGTLTPMAAVIPPVP